MKSILNQDPLVERVVGTIAKAIRPDQVILFGSRVRGKARPDSDLDLLVIYSGPKTKRDLKLEIHRLFPHPDFSMDLFVLTPAELAVQRNVANSLGREALETGVVCHG